LQYVLPKPAGKAPLKPRYARCIVGLDEGLTLSQQKQKAAVWGKFKEALLGKGNPKPHWKLRSCISSKARNG